MSSPALAHRDGQGVSARGSGQPSAARSALVSVITINAASGCSLGALLILVPVLLPTEGPAPATAAYGIATGLALGLGLLSGRVADRWGPRRLSHVAAAALVTAALSSFAGPAVTAAALAVGAGLAAGATYIPALAMVARTTTHGRARRLAIAVSGNAVGGAAGPLVAQALAGSLGPRPATAILLLGTAVVHAATAYALPRAGTTSVAAPAGRAWTPAMRRLTGALAAASAGSTGALGLLVPAALAGGAPASWTATLPATFSLAALAGRAVQFVLAERMPGLVAIWMSTAVSTAGSVGWAVADSRPAPMIAIAAVVGVMHGGFVAAIPTAIVEVIGRAPTGRQLGGVYAGGAVGSIAGPVAVGMAAQTTGTAAGFAVAAMLTLAGMLAVPRPSRWWRPIYGHHSNWPNERR